MFNGIKYHTWDENPGYLTSIPVLCLLYYFLPLKAMFIMLFQLHFNIYKIQQVYQDNVQNLTKQEIKSVLKNSTALDP